MFLDRKSIKIARKVLFIVCLIFAVQMCCPPYTAFAKEVNINYGRGPVELAFINHLDNPTPVANQKPLTITSALPENQKLPYYTTYITVTAYSSRVEECDGDPFTAAWGDHVYWGMVASNYFPHNTKIQLPEEYFGNKMFAVQDTMNKRYWKHIDIWMPSTAAAKSWGTKYLEIKVYK